MRLPPGQKESGRRQTIRGKREGEGEGEGNGACAGAALLEPSPNGHSALRVVAGQQSGGATHAFGAALTRLYS